MVKKLASKRVVRSEERGVGKKAEEKGVGKEVDEARLQTELVPLGDVCVAYQPHRDRPLTFASDR